ncbi:MAG: LysR family transcriptional regulator [Formivibrio sp.]|nr:LysR family transcriptional regulator [Formivibrio sp.]
MELKTLRSFVVLAEELHFGRAAGRLCIVQPALSMQIKVLEEELGVALFDRDRHKVELSAAGKIFLPEAQATLAQAQRAMQRVKSADNGEIGLIRLGFVSSLLPYYLPRLIRELHAQYPLIELELKDMPSPDQLAALKENKLDFGFIRLPIENKLVSTHPVLEESFIVVLPENHPLCANEVIMPLDLVDYPTFILARRFAPGFYDEFLQALKRNGLTLQILQELGEFTTMIALIAAGMGIGIIPRLAMAAKPDHVAVRELCLPDHHSRVGMAWVALDSAIKRTFFEAATQLNTVVSA